MAKITPQTLLAFLCILNILISTVLAGRDIPADSKNEDLKHPDTFKFDRNIHIPNLGRVKIPNYVRGFNPFTYNPAPGIVGGTGQRYIPGGDDTLVPNPGFEVPIPSNIPSAARP